MNTELAIQIEGLGKKYRLGPSAPQASLALREVLERRLRSLGRASPAEPSGPNEIWALKDLSLDIRRGERIGVIGANGAGKTTLLKLLSRITEPSAGKIRLRGRVASLLEVGTGFHPELTGRENVFLNGSLLGMTRQEIHRRFDEIVAFSEVERFLDTPVKRYSSGMYVRLAFAVAAHLEPEILLIDEVLAVGDARFQQKCLGKMREVSGQGRTVLFVTHQMGLVSQLCERAILLQNGLLTQSGGTTEVITTYLRDVGNRGDRSFVRPEAESLHKDLYIAEVSTRNAQGSPSAAFGHNEEIAIALRAVVRRYRPDAVLDVMVKDRLGRRIFMDQITLEKIGVRPESREFEVRVIVPPRFLTSGAYSLWIALQVPYQEQLDTLDEVNPFSVIDTGSAMSMHEGYDYGCVFSPCRWEVGRVS
jgi:lipopolysaccharide transport system ATP-binding protein